jgi:beta-lactamase class A
MLYDPANPGMGKFSEWTNRLNNKIGTTGFGGFELWRLAQPVREKNPYEESFARELDAVMDHHGGDWYMAIRNLNGGMLYERQAAVPVDVGSMIKLPVAMLFFKALELEGIAPSEYGDYLAEEGPGLTYEQLLHAMFSTSDMVAAKVLLSESRLAGLNVEDELKLWGLKSANLDLRKLSARDVVTLYEGLYSGGLLDKYAREYILGLMDENTSNEETRLGILQKTNPASLHFYNHRGSTSDMIVAMGDSALVSVPVVDGEDVYVVVISGFYSDYSPTTDQDLILAIEEMAQDFWSYVRK